MLLSEFDYQLPEELIAQRPTDKRENSRMMVLNRDEHKILNKHFYDIVDLLDENHILILNNTKVMINNHKHSNNILRLIKATNNTLSIDIPFFIIFSSIVLIYKTFHTYI